VAREGAAAVASAAAPAAEGAVVWAAALAEAGLVGLAAAVAGAEAAEACPETKREPR